MLQSGVIVQVGMIDVAAVAVAIKIDVVTTAAHTVAPAAVAAVTEIAVVTTVAAADE